MVASGSLRWDEGGGHLFGGEQKPTEEGTSADKWNSYHSLPPGSYPCNSPLMFGRRDRETATHMLKAGEGYTSTPSYCHLLRVILI